MKAVPDIKCHNSICQLYKFVGWSQPRINNIREYVHTTKEVPVDLKRFRNSHKQSTPPYIFIIVHNFLLCPEPGALKIFIQVGPRKG